MGKGKIDAASVAARRKKRTTKEVFLRRQVKIVERSVGWIEPGEVVGFRGRRSSCSLRGWKCGKNGEAHGRRRSVFAGCAQHCLGPATSKVTGPLNLRVEVLTWRGRANSWTPEPAPDTPPCIATQRAGRPGTVERPSLELPWAFGGPFWPTAAQQVGLGHRKPVARRPAPTSQPSLTPRHASRNSAF